MYSKRNNKYKLLSISAIFIFIFAINIISIQPAQASNSTGSGAAFGYVFDSNSTAGQTIAVGSDMVFNGNGPLLNMDHSAGSSGITVKVAGNYNINFAINTLGNNPQVWGIAVNGTVKDTFVSAGQTISDADELALKAGDIVSIRNIATGNPTATLRPGNSVLTTPTAVNSAWVLINKVDGTSGYVFDNNSTAGQTIPIGQDVTFNSNGPLQNIDHTAGTGGITVKAAGNYNIQFAINSNGNNPQVWGIAVNGTVKDTFVSAGQNITAGDELVLNAGDVVSIHNIATGNPATLRTYPTGGANSAWMQIDKVDNPSGYVFDNNSTSGQSIPVGSDVLFHGNGPLQNIDHTAGTSGITVKDAGTYQIQFAINSNANNPEVWGIAVNGTVQDTFAAAGQNMTAGEELTLNAGDVVSIRNVNTGYPVANLRTYPTGGANSAWVQLDKVNPAPVVLNSIAITTPATKLTYKVGDPLDLSGLVVTGTYSDYSTQVEPITATNVTGFDSSKPAASQTLTLNYDGKTTTYNVVIQTAPVTSQGNLPKTGTDIYYLIPLLGLLLIGAGVFGLKRKRSV